jgi:hypothetical protein
MESEPELDMKQYLVSVMIITPAKVFHTFCIHATFITL